MPDVKIIDRFEARATAPIMLLEHTAMCGGVYPCKLYIQAMIHGTELSKVWTEGTRDEGYYCQPRRGVYWIGLLNCSSLYSANSSASVDAVRPHLKCEFDETFGPEVLVWSHQQDWPFVRIRFCLPPKTLSMIFLWSSAVRLIADSGVIFSPVNKGSIV